MYEIDQASERVGGKMKIIGKAVEERPILKCGFVSLDVVAGPSMCMVREGIGELESGRIRYYGEFTPARTPGELSGGRGVREWDPSSKKLNHRIFDADGNYKGRR